jgi:hypothetical protein
MTDKFLYIKNNPINRKRYRVKKARPVTICIVTIAEGSSGSPKLVFASDRLATNKDGLTFEIGVPKIVLLTPNCAVMNAGDSSRGDTIIWRVNSRILKAVEEVRGVDKLTVDKIIEIFKEEYKKTRKEAIETDIFESKGIASKQFYENMRNYPDWFSLMLQSSIENYDFGVAFLIFGFNIHEEYGTATAHIYQISDTGEPQLLNSIGFGMIGIGSGQSLPEITKKPYSPNASLSQAIVRAYFSKKSAERVAGVGTYTDLGLMWFDVDKETKRIMPIAKSIFLSKQIMDILDKGIEEQKKKIEEIGNEIESNIQAVFMGKPIETKTLEEKIELKDTVEVKKIEKTTS